MPPRRTAPPMPPTTPPIIDLDLDERPPLGVLVLGDKRPGAPVTVAVPVVDDVTKELSMTLDLT